MSDAPEKAVHVFVSGRVQGVWFRGWLAKKADVRGIKGWVRNRLDGRLEAVFVGAPNDLKAILADCRNGPPVARVDDIHTEAIDVPASCTDFSRRPTI